MSPWILLIIAGVFFAFGAWMSFSESFRNGRWFMPAFVSLSVATGMIWVWAVRIINDKERIYFYSLCWDSIILSCYYILPLFFFSFKFTNLTWAGIALIVLGFALVKAST